MLHTKQAMESEASQLAARFEGRNRAEFARTFGVPGGQVMIWQHINARRPISLEAAKAYARGFGCSLADISPRLAEETRSAAGMLAEGDDAPAPDAAELMAYYHSLSDERKRIALGQIKALAA